MSTVTQSTSGQPAAAQMETPPLARDIIDQSMSPFCPGLTLQACPSPSADSLRRDIVARVRAGEPRDVILGRMYTEFGSAVRGAPEVSGFGLVAWVAPAVVVVLGFVMLTRWLRRRAGGSFVPNTDTIRASSAHSGGFSQREVSALAALLGRDP